MNDDLLTMLIIAFCVVVALAVVFLFLIGNPLSRRNRISRNQFAKMVAAQHLVDDNKEDIDIANRVAAQANVNVVSSKLTLGKRLKYAQLNIPPSLFYFSQILISVTVAFLVAIKFDWPLVLISLTSGPIVMNWFVNRFIERRFKEFDVDYSQYLMQLVSLLKTGMNSITAMGEASRKLEPDSLVREEVELMLEKLRFGVPEDKAIGGFGDTVNHPEIELFVQAVLLSRELGGSLADTLEKLSEKVRKRQYFRESAKAAVGMQKNSLVVLIFILLAVMGFLFYKAPEIVNTLLNNSIGWMVVEGAICMIAFAFYWISQITKIRI